MKLYVEDKEYKLFNGDMLDMLEVIAPNSIDAIVCDPPYGLTSITKRFGKEDSAPCKESKDGSFARLSKGFMGKTWDGTGIEYNVDAWRKCYEVLKPGGYLLAFGGTRTYHRIACAIEDAGFEIRDCLMYLYGSGFPKSMNIGKAIDSKLKYNKSNSKALKQLEQSEGTNPHIIKQLNNGIMGEIKDTLRKDYQSQNKWAGYGTALKPAYEPIIMARKPIESTVADNVLKYGVGGINIDECRVGDEGGVKKVNIQKNSGSKNCSFGCNGQLEELNKGRFPANVITDGSDETIKNMNLDIENASRYFYCAKASKKDRDEGLDMFDEKKLMTVEKKKLIMLFKEV